MKTPRDTKRPIRLKVIELLNKYCDSCKVRTNNYRAVGEREAEMYCIRECPYGLEIQKYGRMIEPPERKKQRLKSEGKICALSSTKT